MRKFKFGLIPSLILLSLTFSAFSQSLTTGQEIRYNPITAAVPFLTIAPDSRHGAMGDVGAATSPDATSQYWNPSQYAFTKEKFGFALSYTPWLRALVRNINLAYLSGYYKLDNFQTIGASLRYFSMGEIQLTDQNGTNLANVSPNEYAADFSYSRKLSENLSGGASIRYIRSDLSGGIGAETYVPGHTFSSDVSFFYTKNFGNSETDQFFSAGINLSNIGGKLSYDDGQNKEFLPANLRLGGAYGKELDNFNSLAFYFDINKLLVPTPNLNSASESGTVGIVLPDNSSNLSVVSSVFNSFSDAPGGFKEEMQEINLSMGAEYWYNHKFALRAGYFNEHANKGNRKFFTTGLGVKMNICSFDLSYLIPVNQNNPLANTLRFTLLFGVDSFVKKKEAEPKTEPVQAVPAEATNK